MCAGEERGGVAMNELMVLTFYCLTAFIRPDGSADLQQCKSIDQERKPAFLATYEKNIGSGICEFTIRGTTSTAWPRPVTVYSLCHFLHPNGQAPGQKI